MKLIWATRGRTWGFRFLRDGGFEDPLPVYDEAFSEVGDEPEVCRRVGRQGGACASRILNGGKTRPAESSHTTSSSSGPWPMGSTRLRMAFS